MTDLLELISSNTADIPSLGRGAAVSELKRGVDGGGGAAGALPGEALATDKVELGGEVEAVAGRPQTRPKG